MSLPQKVFAGLVGRVAVVTGASSGIGVQFAKILAEAGMRVAITARRTDRLQTLVSQLEALQPAELKGTPGRRALAVEMDVTREESVVKAMDTIFADLGTPAVLVNNAGVAVEKPALQVTAEDWDLVMGTNLRGVWLVSQATVRKLVAAQKAAGAAKAGAPPAPGLSIINIGSISGMRQATKLVAYSTSKAAMNQLTKVLALEWARHNVRVNALVPGYFQTELNDSMWETPGAKEIIKRIPMQKIGELATDLNGPLLLLASDASRHMTGSILTVDGGHLVSTL